MKKRLEDLFYDIAGRILVGFARVLYELLCLDAMLRNRFKKFKERIKPTLNKFEEKFYSIMSKPMLWFAALLLIGEWYSNLKKKNKKEDL